MQWTEDYQKRISYEQSGKFLTNLVSSEYFIITDKNLEQHYQEKLLQNLHYYSIEPGEASKTLIQANQIIERMLELNLTRNVTIIGFGGGVVCDLAGFTSAIYKRGCKLALLPTSLLAMVDAAIGGKNGVNSVNYKNQSGTIKQPDWINLDSELLKTLPQVELRNGSAEIIKHGLIYSSEYYKRVKLPERYLANYQSGEFLKIIQDSIAIKLHFVADDEADKGKRRYLNFGHTLGHVVEKLWNLPHGDAVVWGMVQALKLSYSSGLLPLKQYEELATDLESLNVVKQLGLKLEWHKLANSLLSDKKRDGEGITFILLQEVGSPVVKELSLEFIRQVIIDEDATI